MVDAEVQRDVIVLRAVEEVENRIAERENRRFRTLYVLVGIVSFVGIGVIAQLVDFYATKAVEQRIERSKQEYESAKTFAQLLALATKLDISDSFSHTDRDAIMRLLKDAKANRQLRAEPAFDALLEKIIDSFTASNNGAFVTQIFDDYGDECTRIPGIVEVLVQHYARAFLGAPSATAESATRDLARFNRLAEVAPTFGLAGTTAVLGALVRHRMADSRPSPELARLLSSYTAMSPIEKRDFERYVTQFADERKLGRRRTPENVRIAEVTRSFAEVYAAPVAAVLEGAADEEPDERD